MSENLQSLLKDALLNNSYDYDVMHNTIKKTWMNSFSYLYSLQKAYVEYEEFFYFSNDEDSRNSKLIGKLYLDKKIYANFDIDYDLIHVLSREEFRLSDFYSKTFTINDMIYNPSIFLKIPIVIIDDQVIWDYKMRVKKECTTFTLPFRRKFVIKNNRNILNDEIIYEDHKIQVLVIDNIFYQRYKMNKSSLYFNTNLKSIKINKKKMEELTLQDLNSSVKKEYMDKWGLKYPSQITPTQEAIIKKEITRRYKAVRVPSQDGTMMCSIHFPSLADKAYELGTALIPLEDKDEYYIAYLTDDIVNKINEFNRDFYISFVFLNRLYQHTFYNDLNTTTATSDGADLMVIQSEEMVPYKTPIPVEDFMVFKKSSIQDGYVLEKNTEMLEMHYPNIYRIKDESMQEGDTYKIYYYYYNTYDLQYTVLFDFYFKFLVDMFKEEKIEKILNDIYYNREDLSIYTDAQKETFKEVFNKILSYQYFNHQYGESDFLNRYMLLDENADKTPFEYKDETLKEWIRIQPWVLRDYVLEQNKLGDSYHLYTNTLDLPSRLRTNTELELGKKSREFDDPRYVFAFSNERDYPLLLDCRVFVDGILVDDVYQERHLFMDYFYVPASMVTEDSYIELEIFPTYSYEKEFMFTSLTQKEEIEIDAPKEKIFPTVADLYFQNGENRYERFVPDITSIVCHYDRGDITFEGDVISGQDVISLEIITLVDEEDYTDEFGNFICDAERTPDEKGEYSKYDDPLIYDMEDNVKVEKTFKYTRMNRFSIQPKNEDSLFIPLKLKFSKCPQTIRYIVQRDGYAYMEIGNTNFNFSDEYIRIFRNGKLMPKGKYLFVTNEGRAFLLFLINLNKGDTIYIDITPYRYTQVYYQESLKEGETLIDLRNYITKPFDIRYYDVYMNGRKLSTNNVFAITPWQISLVNLKSTHNLIIYEREREWEYFGLDYNTSIYYFTMDDLFKTGIVPSDEQKKMIKDIIDSNKDDRLNIVPNTDDEEVIDFTEEEQIYAIFNIFYYHDLIPKTFVNPDVLQFNKSVMTNIFSDVYTNYVRTSYQDSETTKERIRRKNYPEVLCLDPDICIESSLASVELNVTMVEKMDDTDYYDEYGNLICDAERVEDEEGYYDPSTDPMTYSMNKQGIEDPDTFVERSNLVYVIGHLDEVDESYLEQKIEIPTEGNIE